MDNSVDLEKLILVPIVSFTFFIVTKDFLYFFYVTDGCFFFRDLVYYKRRKVKETIKEGVVFIVEIHYCIHNFQDLYVKNYNFTFNDNHFDFLHVKVKVKNFANFFDEVHMEVIDVVHLILEVNFYLVIFVQGFIEGNILDENIEGID